MLDRSSLCYPSDEATWAALAFESRARRVGTTRLARAARPQSVIAISESKSTLHSPPDNAMARRRFLSMMRSKDKTQHDWSESEVELAHEVPR